MNAQERQLREMTPAELVAYGRRSHSEIVWEMIAFELARRLVTT